MWCRIGTTKAGSILRALASCFMTPCCLGRLHCKWSLRRLIGRDKRHFVAAGMAMAWISCLVSLSLSPLLPLCVNNLTHIHLCVRESSKVPADPIMQPTSQPCRRTNMHRWKRVWGLVRHFGRVEARWTSWNMLVNSYLCVRRNMDKTRSSIANKGQVCAGKDAWRQVRAGIHRWTIKIYVRAHRTEGKKGQTEACINLQGQVIEVPEAEPSKRRPMRTRMGMNAWSSKDFAFVWWNISWRDASLTCRHWRCVVELLQCLFKFIRLFLLNKGLKSVQLLQNRGGLASTGYAAQEVVHYSRQEMKLVYMQRGWRSIEEE